MSPADTPPSVVDQTDASIQLRSVLFGRQWSRSPAGQRVLREVTDSRVVGSAVASTGQGERCGVLVRHVRDKSYRLVGVDFITPMPTAATDDFLSNLRRGHHGGGGRTQGPRAGDGKLYTLRRAVNLTDDVALALSKRGDGVLSLGLRRLAAQVRQRLMERYGAVPDLRSIAEPPELDTLVDGAVILVRVYLDTTAIDTLHALGGGNLSRGIRFAVWMHRRPLRDLPECDTQRMGQSKAAVDASAAQAQQLDMGY